MLNICAFEKSSEGTGGGNEVRKWGGHKFVPFEKAARVQVEKCKREKLCEMLLEYAGGKLLEVMGDMLQSTTSVGVDSLA